MVAQAKEILGIGMTAQFAPHADSARHSSRPEGCRQDANADVAPDSPAHADLKAHATEEAEDERYPKITVAERQARERPRQLLENILRRHVEIGEDQPKAILKESLTGPSPCERAAEIAPTHPNSRLMRRMQDSNLREVGRLTGLLLRIKRYQR